MNIVNLQQGSPEWHAHRMNHFNASDAPAMMGCSPYKTRAALIRELATGLGEEVTPEKQRIFDTGHRFEALTRPLAEEVIGEELYPVVGTLGKLSASFDGLTLMNDVAFEHKTLNNDLRAAMTTMDGAALPLAYRVQMEQQLLVSGAHKVLFMATKWDGDTLVERREAWYLPDPQLREQILAGWAQLEADVCNYQPAEVVPQVVADPVEALPVVLVKVSGEIAITANFAAFEAKLREFLEHRLIREPKTDQDFADLDLQIKAMKGAEAALESAEAQMLAQIQSVDTAKKTKDMLHKLVRDNRLMAEKLLASEKERRKAEIVAAGQAAAREHYAALTARVGVSFTVASDFPGAIKGKRSLSSMEEAIDTELARVKIELSRIADLIDGNRKAMDAADAAGLFPDFAQVCTKPADDFANLIASRRAAAAQRLEQERERIRAEEAARLEREQREAAEAKAREEAEAQRRADAEAKAKADAEARAAQQAESLRIEREGDHAAAQRTSLVDYTPAPAPAPEVVPLRAPPAANEAPTLSLGVINGCLGFVVSADFLESLGFVATKERAARLYRPSDFPAICAGISAHVLAVAAEKQAA